jgi:hypothetical protein
MDRIISPHAMFSDEIIQELVEQYEQNEEVLRQLNHRNLANLLVRYRRERYPDRDVVRLISPFAMRSNEILFELENRFHVNSNNFNGLEREVLAQLLDDFRLNGFNDEALQRAHNTRRLPNDNLDQLGGRKNRRSKKKAQHKRRSTHNARY